MKLADVAAPLPEVQSVSVAKVRPEDVIVIEAEGHIPRDVADLIYARIKEVWPDNKCIVLDDNLKMRIARHGD